MATESIYRFVPHLALHEKSSFPLRISLVNVNFFTFTEEILNGKLHFFV